MRHIPHMSSSAYKSTYNTCTFVRLHTSQFCPTKSHITYECIRSHTCHAQLANPHTTYTFVRLHTCYVCPTKSQFTYECATSHACHVQTTKSHVTYECAAYRTCHVHTMGWLRFVGSLKVQVSIAKEPYKRDYILQKRSMILRSLLPVATPFQITCRK